MKLIKQKIQNLRKKLRHWEFLYYTENKSKISDEQYDTTLEELRQLELNYPYLITKNSPTQCIGNFLKTGFNQIYHQVPMLSLSSVNDKSQLLLFDKRLKKKLHNDHDIPYCCELKIDGLAISLLYKQGKLIQAATRGNGNIGENVIENVRTISSIPVYLHRNNNEKLPYLLEIRGEIFITKSCFLELNQMIIQMGNKPFSNSRNAASGSLRQLNPNITALRPLKFCCYGISYHIGREELPDSHLDRLLLCKNWGMSVDHNSLLVKGINKVFQYYENIKKIRSNLEYNIDGIVIKVDNCFDQDYLSYGSKVLNWAVAYKFPAESKITKLKKVIFRVGRTGLITPIAYIQPIIIGDVFIKKVNIHNINEIKRLHLMLGDTVRIQRSGDVIPKILEVILSDRPENLNNLKIIKCPEYCPVCGAILKAVKPIKSYRKSLPILRCVERLTCPAQRKAMLQHFASRKALNIRGMGEKVIDQLVNRKLVYNPVDFFYLDLKKLLELDGYGIKSSKRLLISINNSKKTTFTAFIYSLGIPNVGETISKNLADHYKTLENLISADFQSLVNLKCIGKAVANDIYFFLKNSNNLKNIYDLIGSDVGIRWDSIN